MKRSVFIIIALFFCITLTACKSVIVTSADELTSRNWQTETLSGMKGSLTFSGDTATLIVTSSQDEATLSGHLSIDSKNFYITSMEFFRTYTFSYSVFHNRAEITYGGDTLIFYPVNADVTSAPATENPV